MHVDVILPTYNRADLLGRALDSLRSAAVPAGMTVTVAVVDNNSRDDTRGVVTARMSGTGSRVRYLREERQGRSFALNCGIAATSGDLVAMVDDDEEVDRNWFRTIRDAFADPGLDFIGGPYVPRWEVPRPAWLPVELGAVVGCVDAGADVRDYDDAFPGILMGGNAVVRRAMLDRIGLYATWLGRSGDRLLSGEDRDFYARLRAAGARGKYLPQLIVHHHVPADRCTRSYFRRWMFWHGVSLGMLERRAQSPGARLLGLPRWRHRRAAEGALRASVGRLVPPGTPSRSFRAELSVWEWCGLLYGRHLFRRREARPTLTLEPANVQSASI